MTTNTTAERLLAWLRAHPGWHSIHEAAAELGIRDLHLERELLPLVTAHQIRWRILERQIRAVPDEWSGPRKALDEEIEGASRAGDMALAGAASRLIWRMEAAVA